MKMKDFLKRMKTKIQNTWHQRKIQRTFRMTYDILWNVVLIGMIVGAILTVFAGGIGAGYFASLIKDEPIRDYEEMKNDIYDYEQTTKLYYADHKLIGNVQSELHRESFEIDDAPDVLIDAVIATEDQLFYEHNGIVPKAIIRAIYQEATNAEQQTGGSTLTQQLVKNQILTNEVSFERKAKEILLAIRLENFFDKEEIMEAYLNVIPYGREASGSNIAGIKTAAEGVFGEKPEDLILPQAAFLAGIPKNPYTYTPFTNQGELKEEEALKAGLDRMEVVLKRMYDTERITKEEYEDALEYDITDDFTEKGVSPLEKHPALVFELEKRARDILKEQLAQEDDVSLDELEEDDPLHDEYKEQAEHNLRTKGYEIHSTIQKDMYEKMKKIGDDYEYYGPNNEHDEKEQAAAVLTENETGKILSFYPGRDIKKGESEFNHATGGKGRPPGSTMKPLATYAPAMEMGALQPGSVILDIDYGKDRISNYGGGYYGLVSAREALANSYNVVAEEIYAGILDENPAKNYVEKMGIPVTESDQKTLQFGTGGVEYGGTAEDYTNAFGVFSNQGDYMPSYMIEEITDPDGDTIYEHESEKEEIFSAQTAYLTLDMMRDVISEGTASSLPSRLHNNNVDWAGKTGTSGDYKDAWFIGTNPSVSLGTWIGYETPTSVYCEQCSLSYSQRNQYLWADFVNGLAEIDDKLVTPSEQHKQPDNIVTSDYCASSGDKPSKLCKEAGLVKSDIYNSEYIPTEKDNSFSGGSEALVEVDGEMVVADDKTPSEFVSSEKGGITFHSDWLKEKGYDKLTNDLSALIPAKHADAWKKVSAKEASSKGEFADEKDSKPKAPNITDADDSKISWDSSSDHLIVGYYIYHASNKDKEAKKIDHTQETSFSLPKEDGEYYVKAVNYFGKKSDSSNTVKVKGNAKKDKKKKDKKKEKNKGKKKKEKDD